jgi:hypothetical protein
VQTTIIGTLSRAATPAKKLTAFVIPSPRSTWTIYRADAPSKPVAKVIASHTAGATIPTR